MSKKKLSRDQRQKARKKELARKVPQATSLAYHGRKFQRDELTPVYLALEQAIHQADRQAGGTFRDDQAARAIETLIGHIRAHGFPLPEGLPEPPGEAERQLYAAMLHGWTEHFAQGPQPGPETLVGILRTTLGSIETRGEMAFSPRGYLDFLRSFLSRASGLQAPY